MGNPLIRAWHSAAAIAAACALTLPSAPLHAQSGNGVGSEFELAFWQSVAESDDVAQFQAYLAQYPAGTFAGLARAKIKALGGAVAVPAATASPAPAASAEATGVAVPPQPVATAPAPNPAMAPAANQTAVSQAYPSQAAASQPVGQIPVASAAQASVSAAPAAHAAPSTASGSGQTSLLARVGAVDARAAQPGAAGLLPAPPALATVPEVPLPASFCSAQERNRFHDEVYRPARKVAQDNNRAAIAHLRELQALYDGYHADGDVEQMNAIANAATAYEVVADNSYDVTVAYDRVFDSLMAVQLADCGVSDETS